MSTLLQNQLETHIQNHADLPAEAIVKQDVLRLGLAFEPEALAQVSTYKPKDYFIFSFDHVPLENMEQNTANRAPEEIRISGGNFGLEETVISVRINPESPYRVVAKPDGPHLSLEGEVIAKADYHHVPSFYSSTLESGKKISEIIPVLEWGYLIYITAYRLCQYWGSKEECQFCDINENYRQQKKAGRQYTGIKDPELILEALSHVDQKDDVAKAYTLTGGSVTSELQGMGEVDFYIRYIEAIESRFPGRWISKAVLQAFPLDDCKRLKAAGLQIYHPNYEVWDERLFSLICPGKDKLIGRENWIKRVVDAVDVFGVGNVIPNFVGGVELSKPHGFDSVDQALKSTAEGIDYFMSHGVIPRFTTWCPEPLSHLGYQEAPPLEYFCRLLEIWRERLYHHRLPLPKGYGPVGRGKAVFSVSAFMDVIEEEAKD